MRRSDFEHVIAAAANVIGEDDFVVIGSQAILGAVAEPPEDLLQSMEADIYPRHRSDLSDRIDGALGDGSPFEEQFGYFAHAVGPETAKAPVGWEERLIRMDIPPRVTSDRKPVAWCLEPHDLVLAKLVRGSERDWDYAKSAIRASIVDIRVLLLRTSSLPVVAEQQMLIAANLRAISQG
ncbi:hypothetical protein OJ998_08875 [Solirubrobacter taibaiensis]|nr:hypothetical protein [Solirubrobacter taibaiensis]